MRHGIAKRYAFLLLQIAQKKNLLSQVEQDLGDLVEYLNKNQEIKIFINAPGISCDSKTNFIEKSITKKSLNVGVSFLKLLVYNNHQSFIDEIYDFLKRLTHMDFLNTVNKIY